EPSTSRSVPVVPAVDGRPAPGYVVGAMAADPANVDVVGPETAVKRASEAVTEPVSVTGARERVRQVVTLGVLDPSLRLKTVRPATVSVQIVPAPMERTLRNRPIHLRNLSSSLTAEATPSSVDVTLRGSREAMSRIEADEVAAFVDLAGLGA